MVAIRPRQLILPAWQGLHLSQTRTETKRLAASRQITPGSPCTWQFTWPFCSGSQASSTPSLHRHTAPRPLKSNRCRRQANQFLDSWTTWPSSRREALLCNEGQLPLLSGLNLKDTRATSLHVLQPSWLHETACRALRENNVIVETRQGSKGTLHGASQFGASWQHGWVCEWMPCTPARWLIRRCGILQSSPCETCALFISTFGA